MVLEGSDVPSRRAVPLCRPEETIKAVEVTKAEQEKQVQTIAAERDKHVQTVAAERERIVQNIAAERDRQVQLIAADRNKKVAETAAEQRLAVADLDRKAAEQTKLQQILLGEGEAARKRLVLEADGALEAKLATYEKVAGTFAAAMRGSNWVPSVVMAGGNGGGSASSGAVDLIGLLTAKTAKDLALDMNMRGQKQVTTGSAN